MHKLLNQIKYHSIWSLCLSVFLMGTISSQTKTNLEVFYSLVDSSVAQFMLTTNPPAKIKVRINNGDEYSIFNNRVLGYLKDKGIVPGNERSDSLPLFSYIIEKPFIRYTDIFRDGFLGSYLVQREISLKGNYYYSGSGKKDFFFSSADTVKVDDIKSLENNSYKFTTGTLPPEPFFTGLFEPIAALGTAAAAVILFFTVRSK